MPFLRAVGPAAQQPQLEIQSSKTLIGSGASKCDLVLPRERGVLDLHALLNLSEDQSTVTIVPFSAKSDGACFLNGRLVPPEGATVVHGDRVAFGSADNAYVFSLTDNSGSTKPVPPTEMASLQNSRSFRRALDALRGDRALIAPTPSASQSLNKKGESMRKLMSTSASRDRLERFLLDASTDSLLGDFVERKLRSSNSAALSRRPRPHQRPMAMEPPPSLSESSVASLRSSLNDSILDRSTKDSKDVPLSSTERDPYLSTAERNYAEIEKLRLSQRLREVNNVLNGHLNFSSSYLSTERRSSGSSSMRYSSPLKPESKSVPEQKHDDEEDEQESLGELPTLIEKPNRVATDNREYIPSKPSQLVHHSPTRSVKASIGMILGTSIGGHPRTAVHEDSMGNDEDVDIPLDESLPSFSEAVLKERINSTIKEPEDCSPARSSAVATQLARQLDHPRLPTDRSKTRPQLHQQLIDRTLRRKRHETLVEAFHGWRRGLRAQQQSRQVKARQHQLIQRKLQLVRRNHSFLRWRDWTEHKREVRECREEAFTQRRQIRQLRSVWVQWRASTVQSKQRNRLLRKFVMSVETNRKRTSFQQWTILTATSRVVSQAQEIRNQDLVRNEKRMHAIAVSHHEVSVVSPLLRRVMRAWQRLAHQSCQQKRVLYRMLAWHTRRHQHRAWTTWKHYTALMRLADQINKRLQEELAETKEKTGRQLKIREQQLHDHHEKELNELQVKINEQQRVLQAIENKKLEAEKRLSEAKAAAKAQWHSVVERFLKQAIAEADGQITIVSERLEGFLQQMDVDPEGARFQAASFLIESMLEQKMRQTNERVRVQEELLHAMSSSNDQDGSEDGIATAPNAWKSVLTNNARFLLEMAQQRYARLHQLYQAVAKLAATVVDAQPPTSSRHGGGTPRVDARKFKHAAFLTDAMHDRLVQHLDAVVSVQYRRCAIGGGLGPREARKY